MTLIPSMCSSTWRGTAAGHPHRPSPAGSQGTRRHFLAAYQPAAREVLDQLLEKYTEHGIGQLDDLGVLEVPPLDRSPEIAERFGSPNALHEAVERLEELLYAA